MRSQDQGQEADSGIGEGTPARADIDSLTAEFDALLDRMQTPEARAGMDRLFRASPEELAQAAVDAALKRTEPSSRTPKAFIGVPMTTADFEVAHHELWQELVRLHLRWDRHQSLYSDPKRVELLNATAPSFFGSLQSILLDDTLLGISRLTDAPPKNLTIDVLLEDPALATKPNARTDLEAAIKKVRDSVSSIRKHRNKTIAHLDLEIATGSPKAATLPSLTVSDVTEAIKALEAAFNTHSGPVRNVDTRFELHPIPGDTNALLQTLEDGKGVWQARLLAEEEADIAALRKRRLK